MSLADIFSGGEDSGASKVLADQLAKLNGIDTPSAASLTLPELQKYVQAGILTPEQAKAYTVNSNAFDTATADNAGLDTELSTIGKLQDIIAKGGNDAEEQANMQGILNTLGTTESGNNAAILRDAAARGTGNSGFTLASRLASNQNDATNANKDALDAAAAAEARNLAAVNSAGTLGGAVQGQEYAQETNKANAANAIAEFNANQNQDISKINTTEANAAQAANLATAQDVANKNTVSAQEQEKSVPAAQQQAYEDALQKATAGTVGAENLANQKTQTGQQNAGILGGLLGTAGTVGSAYLAGNPYAALATALASSNTAPNTNVSTTTNSGTPAAATGGRIVKNGVEMPTGDSARMKEVIDRPPFVGPPLPMSDSQRMSKILEDAAAEEDRDYPGDPDLEKLELSSDAAMRGMASGGQVMNMKSGGPVPGMPMVPGDSPQNDTQLAKLSPGEIVLPRSVTQPMPEPSKVMQFLRSLPRPQVKPAVHPRAVLDTLRALDMHHKGMPA